MIAAPQASAQSAVPDDFGAVAKLTNVKELNDRTMLYKQSLKSGGERIGKAKLKLTFGKRLRIAAIWRLDEGTIESRGRVRKRGGIAIAPIIGGSGAYKGAQGKVTFEQITPKRSRQEFSFR